LLSTDVPFVVMGKPYENLDQITHVDNDNILAAREAIEYLITLNHKKIAFIGGILNLVVTIDRLLVYDIALSQAGITLNSQYVIHEEFLQEGGREAISELLKLSEPPTALVVAADLMALGVLKKLDEYGVLVPKDLSIVIFNNVLFTEMSKPPMTSVDINIFEIGRASCRERV